MNLFSKLDAIDIPPAQTISPADQAACNAIQAKYESELSELNHLKTTLEGFPTQHDWTSNNLENLTNRISTRQKEIRKELPTALINHFNNAHNLELRPYDFSHTLQQDQDATPDDVINWVVSQLDGASFHDKAVDSLKERVRGSYSFRRATLKNATLAIPSFVYPNDRYGYGPTIGYSSRDDFVLLSDALAHAENPSVTSADADSFTKRQLLGFYNAHEGIRPANRWGEAIPIGTKLLESFVIYKNGNLRLRFTTPEAAQNFMAIFNLGATS